MSDFIVKTHFAYCGKRRFRTAEDNEFVLQKTITPFRKTDGFIRERTNGFTPENIVKIGSAPRQTMILRREKRRFRIVKNGGILCFYQTFWAKD
jgi:hypothetical protein